MIFQKFKNPILFIGFLLVIIFSFAAIYNSKNNQEVDLSTPAPQDFLESYFKNKTDYDEAFSKFENVKKKPILAAITSHHFLAKELIAQTFAGIDPIKTKGVIIVGPDHFQQLTGTKYFAQTTNAGWHTPFGNMDIDAEIVDKLSQNGEVLSDINTFRGEHSVYLLVPFAKKSFPEAMIVPLILRKKVDYPYYYELGRKVSDAVNLEETILIISSDFSHNASRKQAKMNDDRSANLLKEMKVDNINLIENDCKQCAAFLYGYLEGENTNFELVSNKNSFDISGESPESVTSYVSAYFVKK
jgi:AmmeMemoRadiSam system protein B